MPNPTATLLLPAARQGVKAQLQGSQEELAQNFAKVQAELQALRAGQASEVRHGPTCCCWRLPFAGWNGGNGRQAEWVHRLEEQASAITSSKVRALPGWRERLMVVGGVIAAASGRST